MELTVVIRPGRVSEPNVAEMKCPRHDRRWVLAASSVDERRPVQDLLVIRCGRALWKNGVKFHFPKAEDLEQTTG